MSRSRRQGLVGAALLIVEVTFPLETKVPRGRLFACLRCVLELIEKQNIIEAEATLS